MVESRRWQPACRRARHRRTLSRLGGEQPGVSGFLKPASATTRALIVNAVAGGHHRAPSSCHHLSGVVVGVPWEPVMRVPADRSERPRASTQVELATNTEATTHGNPDIAIACMLPGSRCSRAMRYKLVSVQLLALHTALRDTHPSLLYSNQPPTNMPALQTVHESRPVLGHVYVCATLRLRCALTEVAQHPHDG